MSSNDFTLLIKILEGLSYLAAIGIVYLAYKGLEQIKVGLKQIDFARKTLNLESKRDALRASNEAVRSFFEVILPEYEKHKFTREDRNLLQSIKLDDDNSIDFDAIDTKNIGEYDLKNDHSRNKYTLDIRLAFDKKRQAYNLIESFASTFSSGLADEKSAYTALGVVFCDIIKPYLTPLNHFNQSGYYKNTLTIYNLWSKRLFKEEVAKDVIAAESDIKILEKSLESSKTELITVKGEINKIEDEKIISLGTED